MCACSGGGFKFCAILHGLRQYVICMRFNVGIYLMIRVEMRNFTVLQKNLMTDDNELLLIFFFLMLVW